MVSAAECAAGEARTTAAEILPAWLVGGRGGVGVACSACVCCRVVRMSATGPRGSSADEGC
eukprot:1712756-Pleurochrysis_carterae.AAC.1